MAISIWRCTLKRAASRLSLQRSLSLYNSSHGFCEEEIKRKLAQLKGGSVKLWKRDNGIAELCIHNPEKRNALTGAMAVELEERVCDLEKWQQGKGLIVYGAENTFCSGGDLKTEIAIANKQDGINVCMFMQNITARLQRLMTEGSQIQFIHKHMGLVPVFGGATRLIQLIGSRHALKILSGAVRVHPELALNIGLADEVLSRGADGALEEAQKWISSYTKGPAEVTRAVKKAIVSGRERG
ncbi:ethylmalonyl-CoA decarboxylase-like isoform X2 [Hyperolius riggenbachi]|uniref:ethylmalonyl-CoA decarboxylase-like isoform X2 n=1 Tax=Hyperolius riggenbachi TaxID=752182 RepID=UPI0035A2D386